MVARKRSDIDAVLKSFEEDGDKHNWEMRVESTVSEYLGIKVTPNQIRDISSLRQDSLTRFWMSRE